MNGLTCDISSRRPRQPADHGCDFLRLPSPANKAVPVFVVIRLGGMFITFSFYKTRRHEIGRDSERREIVRKAAGQAAEA